jgi:succinyl-diaminopimelate desuccinylase
VPENLQSSLTDLLGQLVQTPSRASVDSCDGVLALLENWLGAHGVESTVLKGQDGRRIALVGSIGGLSQTSAYILNAPLDTAGFGNLATWTRPPTSAAIENGWLYGRGSADSKAGTAIFCHLLDAFRRRNFSRALGFVFDADEHTGRFGGMRAFLDRSSGSVAGVMIGYPGNDRFCIGARGFWRATVALCGLAAHSGASHHRGVNAIAKASRFVRSLEELQNEIGAQTADAFPLPPKVTVTGIRGGGEFSLIPDLCEVDIDVRLTPSFPSDIAAARISAIVDRIDAQTPSSNDSRITHRESWPAYRLAEGSPIVAALVHAGEQVLGRRLACVIAGPSNVGNLLAARSIDATCGFGVSFRNIHAANECVELNSLEPAFRVYERALEQLLGC